MIQHDSHHSKPYLALSSRVWKIGLITSLLALFTVSMMAVWAARHRRSKYSADTLASFDDKMGTFHEDCSMLDETLCRINTQGPSGTSIKKPSTVLPLSPTSIPTQARFITANPTNSHFNLFFSRSPSVIPSTAPSNILGSDQSSSGGPVQDGTSNILGPDPSNIITNSSEGPVQNENLPDNNVTNQEYLATSSPFFVSTSQPTTQLTNEPTVVQIARNETIPVEGATNNFLHSSMLSSASTSAPLEIFNQEPTAMPHDDNEVSSTYQPGNLTTLQVGLLLSEGLAARLIATTGKKVQYTNGSLSIRTFHGLPDGAQTFPDTRKNNEGGWVYVSNSEMEEKGKGGVGAVTFDKNGNVIDYRMILEGTSMNCNGGGTPWNTWVSCEEIEFDGLIYQVDPFGEREAEVITLGSHGGRWEAFAYDIRNRTVPRFFATEDHNKGALRRFTPDDPNWDDPWGILHGTGNTDFLILKPTSNSGGFFEWTTDKQAAKNNAKNYYPQSEGIDVYGSQVFFVCKRIYQLFTLNLDEGTYSNQTTVHGLFDGKPDGMRRILDDPAEILYFSEEGGKDAGVHGRDSSGRYYTIFESPYLIDETSGLAFSPDGKHMYVTYQQEGLLYDIWRLDGLPFNGKRLDVKYHAMALGK